MGNPLVNELIINTPPKDLLERRPMPEDEAEFQDFYKNPVHRDRALSFVLRRAGRAARRLAGVEPHRPDEHPAQVPGPGAQRLELR